MREGYVDQQLEVPCGHCVGCRLERSRQWAVRCVLESSLYEKNCFITLTYNDQSVPENDTLVKKDWQDFVKRLRKKYGNGIRYYMCGEYGEQCKICNNNKIDCVCKKFTPGLGRPHYHACMFNFDFDDKYPFKAVKLPCTQSILNPGAIAPLRELARGTGGETLPPGCILYRSNSLEELWQKKGYCTIGDVNFESAAYVARYIMKKFTNEDQSIVDRYYGKRLPEYTDMSRRPGVAKLWFEKYNDDVLKEDCIILRHDSKIKTPKYYDEYMKKIDPQKIKEVKKCRRIKAKERGLDWKDLKIMEKVKLIELKKLKRSLENE